MYSLFTDRFAKPAPSVDEEAAGTAADQADCVRSLLEGYHLAVFGYGSRVSKPKLVRMLDHSMGPQLVWQGPSHTRFRRWFGILLSCAMVCVSEQTLCAVASHQPHGWTCMKLSMYATDDCHALIHQTLKMMTLKMKL